jgi:hypothetical protein
MTMAIHRQATNMPLPPEPNTRYAVNPWARKDEDAYYSRDQLRNRGWTGMWIKHFSADKMVRYAGAICFSRFWDRLRIQRIECTQEWQDDRNATAAAAFVEHRKELR